MSRVKSAAMRIWTRPLALGGVVFVALSAGFHFDTVAALTVASLTAMSVRLAHRLTHQPL